MINNKKYLHLDLYEINEKFCDACEDGDLELVKYLLTSPELTQHAQIKSQKCRGFTRAGQFGHLDIIKYLLNSPELEEHVNPEETYDGFNWACVAGYLEVVDYLLNIPDLKDHINIYIKDSLAFREACENNQFQIINYFIIEKNMEVSDSLKKVLEYNLKEYESEGLEYALKIIEKRNFRDKLNDKLSVNNTSIKKVKI